MLVVAYVCVVLAMAVLNHVRGGGFGGQYLPGRAILWVAVAVGGLSLWVLPPYMALWTCLSYLCWGLPGWGRWYTLNHRTRIERTELGWFEQAIEGIAGENDYFAFTLRNAICLLPAAVTLHPLLLGIAIAQTLCYYAAWEYFNDFKAIGYAEVATGAVWGSAIVGLSLGAAT